MKQPNYPSKYRNAANRDMYIDSINKRLKSSTCHSEDLIEHLYSSYLTKKQLEAISFLTLIIEIQGGAE